MLHKFSAEKRGREKEEELKHMNGCDDREVLRASNDAHKHF